MTDKNAQEAEFRTANRTRMFDSVEDKDFSHLHTFAVRAAPWDADEPRAIELLLNCHDRNNAAVWIDAEVVDELIGALQKARDGQ